MLKRAIAAAAMAAAATAVVIIPAAPAQARACIINHYCYTTWYSDASHTVVVGEKYESCNGTISMWGRRTPYITFTENPC